MRQWSPPRWLVLFTLLVGLYTSLSLHPPTGVSSVIAASQPVLTLSVDNGRPGLGVGLEGANFPGEHRITVIWRSPLDQPTTLDTFMVGDQGQFTRAITLPLSAHPGLGYVAALDRFGHELAHADYEVHTDWRMLGFSPERTGVNPWENVLTTTNVSHLATMWTYAAGATTSFASSPAVVNGSLYIGGSDGALYALDAQSGAVAWRYQTGKYIYASPAFSHDTVIVGSLNGKVYGVDASTGKLRWQYTMGPEPTRAVWSSPVYAQGRVYIGSSSLADTPLLYGNVVALDAETGHFVWEYRVNVTPPAGGVWNAPTLDTTTHGLYFSSGNPDDTIYRLNADTGKLDWAYRTVVTDTHDLDLSTSPIIYQNALNNNVVVVGSKNGTLYCVDAHKGTFLWKYVAESSIFTTPSEWNNQLYFVARGFGKKKPPVVIALNATTGELLWRYPVTGDPTATPVIANGLMFVALGTSNHLMVFDAVAHQLLRTYTLDGTTRGSPAIVNGQLYVGTDKVYMMALPTLAGVMRRRAA